MLSCRVEVHSASNYFRTMTVQFSGLFPADILCTPSRTRSNIIRTLQMFYLHCKQSEQMTDVTRMLCRSTYKFPLCCFWSHHSFWVLLSVRPDHGVVYVTKPAEGLGGPLFKCSLVEIARAENSDRNSTPSLCSHRLPLRLM